MYLKTTELARVKAGAPFTWGNVIKIHEIGAFTIIEAQGRDRSLGTDPPPMFHCYVNEKNTHHASRTLEGALVLCIAQKNTENPNDAGHNARCAAMILNIKSDYV